MGIDKLSPWVAILITRHLVEKMFKEPCVNKIIHYEQCLPHPMNIEQTSKYFRKQQITHTKEVVKSSNNEIDNFFTTSHLIYNAKVRCYRN